jgi:hypothetical protein
LALGLLFGAVLNIFARTLLVAGFVAALGATSTAATVNLGKVKAHSVFKVPRGGNLEATLPAGKRLTRDPGRHHFITRTEPVSGPNGRDRDLSLRPGTYNVSNQGILGVRWVTVFHVVEE